jgi:hypothetical protein
VERRRVQLEESVARYLSQALYQSIDLIIVLPSRKREQLAYKDIAPFSPRRQGYRTPSNRSLWEITRDCLCLSGVTVTTLMLWLLID